ncbi:NTP transferase domain-containing protein [Streptomyces meridianus]|uniref:Molybdenum cofactor guanylyltransferase n=1 Tax=Streptomyces meridianus TaxID=2938945 RepID=A0ABT0X8D3_9ACTN|nr:NTP transferase domain-containing protein [Streptomyces meridianus]MCM2578044.1 molybdenum cofactor guanylyltransferase [Streptomyces meridianus]
MTGFWYDAVVLAGGAATRLGGTDKPAVHVGARPLLDRVLHACAEASRTVVVGPRRPTARPVRWAREQPPGGGPLAALDAGLREVTAPAVLVLSADLPFLTPGTVRAVTGALDGPSPDGGAPDGVVLTDADGRDQPLAGVYRTEPLRRELALLATEYGSVANLPVRALTRELALLRHRDPVAAFDCDTWEDMTAARLRIREHGSVLDEWIAAVKDELGIELDVATGALLDLARDAAHGVTRPAAPLTTFLVGYAAAQAGGGPEAVAEATRRAAALAARWTAEEPPGESAGHPPGEPGSGSPDGPEKTAG